jgi:DNA invertase Pin-like site-specific DNA recombinase
MIYGYARVSTEAQDLTGSTARCQKIFCEKMTGTTADRPQLKKLVAALAHGDRLSRNKTDLLVIAREMQRAGAGHPLTGRAVPRYDIGLCRDRVCDPWRCREAGKSPHQGAHGARPRRREGQRRQIRAQAELTTHQQREAIRRRDVDGETLRSIGRSYNVSPQTISRLTA